MKTTSIIVMALTGIFFALMFLYGGLDELATPFFGGLSLVTTVGCYLCAWFVYGRSRRLAWACLAVGGLFLLLLVLIPILGSRKTRTSAGAKPIAAANAGESSRPNIGHMKTLSRFLVFAAVGTSLTATPAQKSRPVLRQVEERLRPILAGLSPAPTVEYPEYSQSLLVYYRPQKFWVHGRSKTGAWSTNVVEQVGPSFTGFVLRIHLESLGEVNQAVTPQTIQEPYWRTFLDVTPIAGTTNQIYWALSSAGGTDEQALARVRQALGSLAGRGPKTEAAPGGAVDRSQPIRLLTNGAPSAAGSRR